MLQHLTLRVVTGKESDLVGTWSIAKIPSNFQNNWVNTIFKKKPDFKK